MLAIVYDDSFVVHFTGSLLLFFVKLILVVNYFVDDDVSGVQSLDILFKGMAICRLGLFRELEDDVYKNIGVQGGVVRL